LSGRNLRAVKSKGGKQIWMNRTTNNILCLTKLIWLQNLEQAVACTQWAKAYYNNTFNKKRYLSTDGTINVMNGVWIEFFVEYNLSV